LFDGVAVTFSEAFQGSAAAVRPGATGGPLTGHVDVEIPSLGAFLDGDRVARVVGGRIQWPGLAEGLVVTDGHVVLFLRAGRETRCEYALHGMVDGAAVDVYATKILDDGTGFDAPGDLTHLTVRVDVGGVPVGAGLLTSDLAELIQAYETASIADALDPAAARRAFLDFLNREIQKVYPSLPAVLEAGVDKEISAELRRSLQFMVRLMLPSPLPAGGQR